MSNNSLYLCDVITKYLRWCTAIEEVVDYPSRGKWVRMTLGEFSEDIEFKLLSLLDSVNWRYEVIDKLIEAEERLFDKHFNNTIIALSSPLY